MIDFLKKNFAGLDKNHIGGGLGGFILNIIGQILVLGITVVLTHLMTPEGYGLYAMIISLMFLLAIPFASGFSTFVMRHISSAIDAGRHDLCRGLILRGGLWVFGGALLVAGVSYALLPGIAGSQGFIYRAGLGLVILPPLLLLLGAILRGARHVLWGRFPQFFVQPAILLLILSLICMTGINNMPVHLALGFHIGSYAVAISACLLALYFLLPKDVQSAKAGYENKKWITSALPLIFAAGLIAVSANIDIVMVGAMAGEAEAGQYRVASQLAGFVLIFLFASSNALSAVISAKHMKGEKAELQKFLTSAARLMMMASLPVFLILYFFRHEIFELLFDTPFTAGVAAFALLSMANLFSVVMGQAGHVLSATGHEKYAAYSALTAVAVNIGLNMVLIPSYGLNGASLATFLSIIVWKILLGRWTKKKTGYRCTIFGGGAK